VGAQLVGEGDPVAYEVLAGPAGGAQRCCGGAVGDQCPQPGPVGAKGVGQDVGVEPVVFVAGRAVARAQVLELVGADDHHAQAGVEQRGDDRPVGAFDRGLAHAELGEAVEQPTQPGVGVGVGVGDGEPVSDLAGAVDDGHDVVVFGPVQSGGQPTGWCRGQDRASRAGIRGVLRGSVHHRLLAASPSGEAPLLRCRDAAAGSLTVRRSVALSPVDGRHAPGDRRASQNSCRTSKRQASRAMTRRHLGCIGDLTTTDQTRVHQ